MERGALSPPGEAASAAVQALTRMVRPMPERVRALAAIDPSSPEATAQIWPRLGLISRWADGAATRFAQELAARFPQAQLQPKGLLATEAMISLPWVGQEGHVLAVTSHFLEFEAENGEVRLAHELAVGQFYSVVVTTGGGLYRYRLYDQVEVVGRLLATPCIRFVGKTDRVADWFGEKLNEQFVAGCIAILVAEYGLEPRFVLLAPDEGTAVYTYTLFIESDRSLPSGLAMRLDRLLRRNFHYDGCRCLGQLGPAQVVQVRDSAATYLAVCQARGMKLGNIKPAVLDSQTGWRAVFEQVEPVAL
jgi:hypothetical protein